MAPSNMFSYLRSGHAKRSASNFASQDPVPSPSAFPLPSPSQSTDYFTSPRLSDSGAFPSSSPVSPYPPQLPPIPRVASKLNKPGTSSLLSPQAATGHASHELGASEYAGSDRDVRSPALSTHDEPPPSSHDDTRPSTRSTSASLPTGFRAPKQTLAQVVKMAVHTQASPAPSSTHMPLSSTSLNSSGHSKSQVSLVGGQGDKSSCTSKATVPTGPPPKTGKSRLTLRNPMSLLMRRKSGQTLDPLADESIVTHRAPSVPPIPDNFDPSIRGRIVHDFSAPRPDRNFSYNNAYAEEPKRAESPSKIERGHTPVFHEHFDDDTSYEESQAAIRAEKLANNDFVKRNSYVPPPLPGRPPPPLPKDSPPSSPPESVMLPLPPAEQPREYSSSFLAPVQEAPDPVDTPFQDTPRKGRSTKTPPASRSRATSVTDPSYIPAGLPAHFTSRASRFSFQIGGGDSAAQEKLLEERHKQKAEKVSKQEVRASTDTIEDEYDEFGIEDDFDMDGGYEEEIPMLGEEDNFGGLGGQTLGMNGFDFSPMPVPSNISTLNPPSMSNEADEPFDESGHPIGFATSDNILRDDQTNAPEQASAGRQISMNDAQGLGLSDPSPPSVDAFALPLKKGPQHIDEGTANEPAFVSAGIVEDDMYFDDGMIDEHGHGDIADFDEDIFDDPAGPLFERKVKAPPAGQAEAAAALDLSLFPGLEAGQEGDMDSSFRQLEVSAPASGYKTLSAQPRPHPDLSNLNAYHSALANAANRAEAQGRFARKASVDIGSGAFERDEPYLVDDSRLSLVPDDGRSGQEISGFMPDENGFGISSGFVDDYDYSEFDSTLEDDPMIAAANAEALSIDYDGFYGQEFGFYASAQGEADNTYGGFFGPSGIGRSVSGRNAVREPNLTPITERSEYSTRNSFISVNHFRDSSQPLASPGLAQLARMSPYGWHEDGDLSMDALRKLRKGTFGSSSSLPPSSSNSPRNSSGMGMQYVPRTASPAGNRMHEQNESPIDSDDSAEIRHALDGDDADSDDAENGADSPTLTASDYNTLSSPSAHHRSDSTSPVSQVPQQRPASPPHHPLNFRFPISPINVTSPQPPSTQSYFPATPLSLHTSFQQSTAPSSTVPANTAPRRQSVGFASPISTTSPITPGGGGNSSSGSAWRPGHSRKGSGADSVAYVREQDECGSERWVLERRRTAESGELELVGREIIEGGRI